MALIRFETRDAVATLALDHAEKRNALGHRLIDDILDALSRVKEDDTRVLILRAAGSPPVWSAGHDVDELPSADREPLPYDDPMERLIRAIRRLKLPVIAMVHGSVWGGACDVVMNCDMVIGDETCSFAMTPAKLGVPYNASGILHFMNRLPLNIVKEMFFTAEPIGAERAFQVGILNHLVPAAGLEGRTLALAQTIASRSPQAIAAFKDQVRILTEAVAINPTTFEYIQDLRRQVYTGQDYQEGIRAFREKRPPRF
jgi:methylmalonyl-CoA decarboxylase